MVYSVGDEQFTRRRVISLTNPPTVDDYQVNIPLSYSSTMNADFSDIRFTDKYGIVLDYWIQEHIASTSAVVWVKVPNQDTYIYMYYGNSTAEDASEPDAVFDDYDGFDDTSGWDTVQGDISASSGNLNIVGTTSTRGLIERKTSFSTNTIMECRMKREGSDPAASHFLTARTSGDWSNKIDLSGDDDDTGFVFETRVSGTTSKSETLGSWTQGTYYQMKIARTSTDCKLYQDDALLDTKTTNIPTGDLELVMYEGIIAGTTVYVDWVLIRKYLATEPTVTIGNEQHQRRVPQIM